MTFKCHALLKSCRASLSSINKQNCSDIKGLSVENTIFTITQLADDTTIFLQDECSVVNLIYVIDRFYESSGLRLHKQKSEVLLLGSCSPCNNLPGQIKS